VWRVSLEAVEWVGYWESFATAVARVAASGSGTVDSTAASAVVWSAASSDSGGAASRAAERDCAEVGGKEVETAVATERTKVDLSAEVTARGGAAG
jgi:hypothetical protein